jgi:hypothetical protein
VDDATLTAALMRPPEDARAQLRRLLVREQTHRDAVAQQALRPGASDLADTIDMLPVLPGVQPVGALLVPFRASLPRDRTFHPPARAIPPARRA